MPKAHQKRVIDIMESKPDATLCVVHTVGSGKTLTAVIVICMWLRDRTTSDRIVFVAPVSLKANLGKEWSRAYGTELPTSVEIISPEIFSSTVIDLTGVLLIIDEVHIFRTKIERNKGKRAAALIEAANGAKKILLLTATPLINTEYDIENILALLDRRQPRPVKEFLISLEIPEVKRRSLEGRFDFYQPNARDLKHYPTLIKVPVFFEMPENVYEEYHRQELLLKGCKSEIDELVAEALEGDLTKFYTGLRLAGNLTDDSPDAAAFSQDKASWIVESMKRTPGEKWLVYSSYIKYGTDIIAEAFESAGIKFRRITSKMPTAVRQEVVREANEVLPHDAPAEALLVSRVGGTGIDLHGFTRAVKLEASWNFAEEEQLFGRVVRYNSLAGTNFTEVHGYLMMMVKPNEYAAGPDLVMNTPGMNFESQLKSIDLLLYSRSQAKKKRVDVLFRDIKIYNSELADLEHLLMESSQRLTVDLRPFAIELSQTPLSINLDSDVADITSHTVAFAESNFNFVVRLRLMELPVLLGATIPSSIENVTLITSSAGTYSIAKIYTEIVLEDIQELTFSEIVHQITGKLVTMKPGCDLIRALGQISPYIAISSPDWSHVKHLILMNWLRKTGGSHACISAKFIGARTLDFSVEINRRNMILYLN